MELEEIQETESKYLTPEEILKILHEEDDPNRPLNEYDLSSLYLQIGLDFLVPHKETLDILIRELKSVIWRQIRLCRLLKRMDYELEQRLNQQANLGKRIFALEERQPGKKHSYKEYTI